MEINLLTDIELPAQLKLILLDLDNTLYPYKPSHEAALGAVASWVKAEFNITEAEFTNRYMDARRRVQLMLHGTAAGHSRLFYFQLMFEALCGFTHTEATAHCNTLYWDTFISSMVMFDDAKIFLEKCHQQNIQITIVTDMLAEVQYRKMQHLGLHKYVKLLVTSEEVGVEKPNPYIYLYAIEKSRPVLAEGDYIAVVGDDVKKDLFTSIYYPTKEYLIKHVS